MRNGLFAGILILLMLPLGVILAQTGGEIAYGDEVSGTITEDAPLQEWTFEGSADDLVTIEMIASDSSLDSLLQLRAPDGDILTENDDASNVTVDSRIDAFPLPDDGTYTIIATRFGLESGFSEGSYSLTLRQVTADEAGEDPGADGALSYGDTVTGTLNRQNFEDRWQFVGEAGDVISIRMGRSEQTSDLDSFLRLLDEENRELERNDDSAQGILSSEIAGFTLPYSGTYTIVATRFGFESGTSSGGYILELTSGGAPSAPADTEDVEEPSLPSAQAGLINYGDFADGSLASGETASQQFAGVAGDVVTISVKRGEGALNPAVQLQDSSGNTLAENDSFNGTADARIVDFALPASDTYTITIIGENGSAGDYVLHLFATATSSEPAAQEPEPEETAPPIQPPAELPDLSEAGLVITLSWDGPADFDLEVREPDGDFVNYNSTESDSGGVFGGDANSVCAGEQEEPSETIYWLDDPPSGDYRINVAFVFPCGSEGTVTYTITIMQNGEEVDTIMGEMGVGEFESYDQTLD
jgi:hypothetical protein